MRPLVVSSTPHLKGSICLYGDKSIAHRSLIISAITCGKTRIENFPANEDCLATLSALKKLGIKIIRQGTSLAVFGKGLRGLKKSQGAIFTGDSGTTLRLLLGILAGQRFSTRLAAGKSLSRRPMLRVTRPLRMMGAKINARGGRSEEYPPITISGGYLRPITYKMPVASAQVKSAILLAALFTKGETSVIEPIKTRDHTERMLKLFGADIKLKGKRISIRGSRELVTPKRIYLPADISSASFFMVLASILPDAEVSIRKVSLNPGRAGIIKVLKRMRANIRVTKSGSHKVASGSEPMGDIIVKSSCLKGAIVKKEEVPGLIDELPILMVAASLARGKTVLEGVGELRVKETDRIRSMSGNLKKMGGRIKIINKNGENIVIQGSGKLKGARVNSFGDHRTAMSMVVAGLAAAGKTRIDDISCISKSFPDFLSVLRALSR